MSVTKVVPVLLLLTSACAYQVRDEDRPLVITDKPSEAAFAISLQSQFRSRHLCIETSSWPNAAGWMEGDNTKVLVVIRGKSFKMKPFDSGDWYCPGGCSVHVAPGETLVASIPYSHFDIPAELYEEEKRLTFPIIAWACSRSK